MGAHRGEPSEGEDEEVVALLGRIQKAELRSSEAVATARETQAVLATMRDHAPTREQLADQADREQRILRNIRRLVVICAACLLLVILGVWRNVSGVDDAGRRLDRQVEEYQSVSMATCLKRNEQLQTQRELYDALRKAEDKDRTQSSTARKAKVAAYKKALADLPDPIDCDQFGR